MHIQPPSDMAVRIARHIVTHPERYQHIPAPDREAMLRRSWAALLTAAAARRHAERQAQRPANLPTNPHSGDAA